MSQDRNHLNHATWECKYHVVLTPKYRKKLLFYVMQSCRSFFWSGFIFVVGACSSSVRVQKCLRALLPSVR
jgi:hypothetical protein